MKTAITFEIDTDNLEHKTDSYIATLWHIAQANPVEHGDRIAGELAELIGREVIRRWLVGVPAELWIHQGRDHCSKALSEHCVMRNGKWVSNAEAKHHDQTASS